MSGFYNLKNIESLEQLVPNVSPDAFSVAPQIDATEQFRIEVDDTDESKPIRITSDIRLILHTKDLASRAGISIAQKFGQNSKSASQIQQLMDKMSDDDLLNTVRSRYVQAPSEILAWSKDLAECVESLELKAQELIDSENAKQAEEVAAPAPAASE